MKMRLIDADALIDELGISDEDIIFEGMLEDAPTIDAVPVVRCKDCVYRVIVRNPLMGMMDCYGCKVMCYNEDDWYCSFGERKDDE